MSREAEKKTDETGNTNEDILDLLGDDAGEKEVAGEDKDGVAEGGAELDIATATPEVRAARLEEIKVERADLDKKLAAEKDAEKKAKIEAEILALDEESAGIAAVDSEGDETGDAELKKNLESVTAERDALKAKVEALEKTPASGALDEATLAAVVSGSEIFAYDSVELDKYAKQLRDGIRALEDALEDAEDGEVELSGKKWPVKSVKSRLRDLQDEQAELIPQARARLQKVAEAETDARAKWPNLFNPAHADHTALKALENELPFLKFLPKRYAYAVEILAGRKALAGGVAKATDGAKAKVKPRTTMRAPKVGGAKKEAGGGDGADAFEAFEKDPTPENAATIFMENASD